MAGVGFNADGVLSAGMSLETGGCSLLDSSDLTGRRIVQAPDIRTPGQDERLGPIRPSASVWYVAQGGCPWNSVNESLVG